MTTRQMKSWIEAMPEAARLVDAEGHILAKNLRAGDRVPERKHIVTHDLSAGLTLETWKTLNAADLDLRSLANGLAHTLRNPLSSIMTAADLVQDDPHVGEESAMLLGIISKESRQLNRILTDFLNYVRPRTNEPMAFDLAKSLRDVVQELQQENVLSEAVQIEDDLPDALAALGDENAIRQSLRQVVKNAAEAMDGHGKLHLCGKAFDARGRVQVEDSGPGFSGESLHRAFEPFYSYTPESAGLGLAVALSAVERAGGRIAVENVHYHPHESRADFEYSNLEKTSQKPVQGARVCIELNAPNGEINLPQADEDTLRKNEIVTI